MSAENPAGPKVLLVTEDPDLRDTFTLLLEEVQQCQSMSVATGAEALRAAAAENYALVLLSTFRSGLQPTLALAKHLRHLTSPTPVGLFSSRPQPPSEMDMHALAFLLPMPFELDEFAAHISGALARHMTATEQAHARTVRTYLDALQAHNWQALLALCTSTVRLYPSAHARVMRSQRILGQQAVREYLDVGYPQQSFADTVIYARAHGFVARYTTRWRSADGHVQQAAGSMLFHFCGERIDQIALRFTPPIASPDESRLVANVAGRIQSASAV